MDKKTYMEALKHELRHLPKADREEALLYYSEYFDDAGLEREAEVIEELGEAKDTAAQILKEVAIKRLEEPKRAANKGFSTLWIVILALCAAPIGLPLLLVILVVGIAMMTCVLALFFTLFVVGITLLVSGIAGIGAGIYFVPTQFANALAVAGSSLVVFGFGLLILMAAIFCCKAIFRGIARGTKKILTGGKCYE